MLLIIPLCYHNCSYYYRHFPNLQARHVAGDISPPKARGGSGGGARGGSTRSTQSRGSVRSVSGVEEEAVELASQAWFHGKLPRSETIPLLREYGETRCVSFHLISSQHLLHRFIVIFLVVCFFFCLYLFFLAPIRASNAVHFSRSTHFSIYIWTDVDVRYHSAFTFSV